MEERKKREWKKWNKNRKKILCIPGWRIPFFSLCQEILYTLKTSTPGSILIIPKSPLPACQGLWRICDFTLFTSSQVSIPVSWMLAEDSWIRNKGIYYSQDFITHRTTRWVCFMFTSVPFSHPNPWDTV